MRAEFSVNDPNVNSYRLLTAVVVPRPIAWVTTVSETGLVNLAPHSFYTVACARPPIVQFSSVGKKDTLRNVLATGEFVVNLSPASLLEQVNNSAARFPPDGSEVEALGIDMEPSVTVRPPRVAASPAAIECTVHSTNELGDSTVVLGDVRLISIDERVLVDGHPDFTRLDPLARLGKEEWALRPEVISVKRPTRPEDIRPSHGPRETN